MKVIRFAFVVEKDRIALLLLAAIALRDTWPEKESSTPTVASSDVVVDARLSVEVYCLKYELCGEREEQR